jgi:signal transduction histidine kinase
MDSPSDDGLSNAKFWARPDTEIWPQVVKCLPDAVLLLDVERQIQAWNPAAAELYGYSESQAIGQSLDDLLPKSSQTGDRRRGANGLCLNVRWTETPLADAEGQEIGWVVQIRHDPGLEGLTRQSQEARKAVRLHEIAAQVAHEVRNPLAGIHGALQILRRRLDPGPEENQVFDEIALEIHRLNHLVNDLQRYSRPISTSLSRVDLSAWLRSEFLNVAPTKQVEIGFDPIDLQPCWVHIDPLLMTDVLQNLLENAIDAQPQNPRVRLNLETDQGYARLEFQDYGGGIAEEIRKRIMDPFFTTKARGSGLGLALCRRNVEGMGGTLELQTTEPDQGDQAATGARLLISLPLA